MADELVNNHAANPKCGGGNNPSLNHLRKHRSECRKFVLTTKGHKANATATAIALLTGLEPGAIAVLTQLLVDHLDQHPAIATRLDEQHPPRFPDPLVLWEDIQESKQCLLFLAVFDDYLETDQRPRDPQQFIAHVAETIPLTIADDRPIRNSLIAYRALVELEWKRNQALIPLVEASDQATLRKYYVMLCGSYGHIVNELLNRRIQDAKLIPSNFSVFFNEVVLLNALYIQGAYDTMKHFNCLPTQVASASVLPARAAPQPNTQGQSYAKAAGAAPTDRALVTLNPRAASFASAHGGSPPPHPLAPQTARDTRGFCWGCQVVHDFRVHVYDKAQQKANFDAHGHLKPERPAQTPQRQRQPQPVRLPEQSQTPQPSQAPQA